MGCLHRDQSVTQIQSYQLPANHTFLISHCSKISPWIPTLHHPKWSHSFQPLWTHLDLSLSLGLNHEKCFLNLCKAQAFSGHRPDILLTFLLASLFCPLKSPLCIYAPFYLLAWYCAVEDEQTPWSSLGLPVDFFSGLGVTTERRMGINWCMLYRLLSSSSKYNSVTTPDLWDCGSWNAVFKKKTVQFMI